MTHFRVQVQRTEIDITPPAPSMIKVWRDVHSSDGRIYTFCSRDEAQRFADKWYAPNAVRDDRVRIVERP